MKRNYDERIAEHQEKLAALKKRKRAQAQRDKARAADAERRARTTELINCGAVIFSRDAVQISGVSRSAVFAAVVAGDTRAAVMLAAHHLRVVSKSRGLDLAEAPALLARYSAPATKQIGGLAALDN